MQSSLRGSSQDHFLDNLDNPDIPFAMFDKKLKDLITYDYVEEGGARVFLELGTLKYRRKKIPPKWGT